MIYIRDDDVMVDSSSHDDVVGRFRGVHSIIVKAGAMHRPGILIAEIQRFPEAIEFVKLETAAGRMEPQFHGLRHVDYGKLTHDQIRDHLQIGQMVFELWGLPRFTRFYTPWGASADFIQQACEAEDVVMVDCDKDYHPATNVRRDPDASYEKYKGKEIMIHWWEGLGKLTDALEKTKK
jgi:peptidoglycan/xylan/chitin deacetylase (PgdA/CDA1 family)